VEKILDRKFVIILIQHYGHSIVVTNNLHQINRLCKLFNSLSTCLLSTSVLTLTSPIPTLHFLPLVTAADLRTLLISDVPCFPAIYCCSLTSMQRLIKRRLLIRKLLLHLLQKTAQARRKAERARRFNGVLLNL
jgi:hypothetical protein